MQEKRERPHRVPVAVKGEQGQPNTNGLARDGLAQQEAAAENLASDKSEQDWQERYLRLAADLDNTKKRLNQTYARQAEQEKERLSRSS